MIIMSEPTIFSKIISGEIPADKIYEDERTIAFLDREPLADGHILVVSKTPVDPLWELSDEDYNALWQTARKMARRVQEVMQPQRVGTVVEGFGVPHAHIHIVPLYDSEVLRLHHGYPVHKTPENLAKISAKLRL
jgi:histidine triad (HIT) family protein